MMKKFFSYAVTSFATLAVFVANTYVGPMCLFVGYEPEIPECLKK
ncbi:MAG: cyclic lactone autoinducer peptide [Syntrophomonadaceae bacterium]|jgi:cyclic lactone autoinducer peptide